MYCKNDFQQQAILCEKWEGTYKTTFTGKNAIIGDSGANERYSVGRGVDAVFHLFGRTDENRERRRAAGKIVGTAWGVENATVKGNLTVK